MVTAKEKEPRSKFAALVAGLKESLSKKQDELDEAGVERKALTPEIVDELREGLEGVIPNIEEETATAIMQMVVDVLAEAQPDSDVDEENAMDDEEDKAEEDEEEEKQVAALVEQVTQMGKDYNHLIKDMSEVVQLNIKSAERMNADTKAFNDLAERLAKVEKAQSRKPRRASQAKETELDPSSKLAEEMKAKTFEPPPAFADMFTGGAK